ncbi:MAG: hypothetical protein ABIZ69_04330, partial [Ilumatobacteraceae bacterium]
MRTLRHSLVVVTVVCCALGACSSDAKPAGANTPTNSGSSVAAAANLDCTALKTSAADIIINWQVVIGLSDAPTTEWPKIPIGTITQFGDQLAALTAALGNDANAAASLAFMSGANDIVKRGMGGDPAAQADLAAYMGTDLGAN